MSDTELGIDAEVSGLSHQVVTVLPARRVMEALVEVLGRRPDLRTEVRYAWHGYRPDTRSMHDRARLAMDRLSADPAIVAALTLVDDAEVGERYAADYDTVSQPRDICSRCGQALEEIGTGGLCASCHEAATP